MIWITACVYDNVIRDQIEGVATDWHGVLGMCPDHPPRMYFYAVEHCHYEKLVCIPRMDYIPKTFDDLWWQQSTCTVNF